MGITQRANAALDAIEEALSSKPVPVRDGREIHYAERLTRSIDELSRSLRGIGEAREKALRIAAARSPLLSSQEVTDEAEHFAKFLNGELEA